MYDIIRQNKASFEDMYDQLALLDVAQGFAKLMQKFTHCCWTDPEFTTSDEFLVKNCYHVLLLKQQFVP